MCSKERYNNKLWKQIIRFNLIVWGGGEKVFSLKLKYAHQSLSIESQDIVYFLYYSDEYMRFLKGY